MAARTGTLGSGADAWAGPAEAAEGGSGGRVAEALQALSPAEAGALLRLAAPLTATALVNMGMTITDVMMMGRLGPLAVAAGAVISDLYSIVFYLCAGVLAAVAGEAAGAVGARRGHALRGISQQGLWMAGLLAPPAAALLWHAPHLLHRAGIAPEVAALTTGYAQTMALTLVPMLGVALWRNVLAPLGRARVILWTTLCALPANALFDALFMFGFGPFPALGLTGAGAASLLVASGMFAGLTTYAATAHSLRRHRLLARFARPDARALRRLIRVGLPIGVTGLGEVGVFLISTPLAALFGAEALAAHAIALRTAGLVYALPNGLGQAATVRAGYAAGARDRAGLRRAGATALAIGLAAGAGLATVLMLGREAAPWLFLTGGQGEAARVAEAATALLALLAVVVLGQGVGVVGAGVLRGVKDTAVPMAMTVAGFWGVGLGTIAAAGFAAGWGPVGIWTGIAAGSLTVAALMAPRLALRLAGGR